MNKRFLIILLIGCFNTFGQNKDSINANQREKLEDILINGEYEFNAYSLVRVERNDGDKLNNNDYDPVTFELIDLAKDKNNLKGDSRENKLPSFEIKKLDSMIEYKFINKNSIITLKTENENYPIFTIDLISNQLELINSGHILNFEKEVIVKDKNNILQNGWAGFIWQKDIYHEEMRYGHSVIIGRTYDSNKIYFNIKTFVDNKKTNWILISEN